MGTVHNAYPPWRERQKPCKTGSTWQLTDRLTGRVPAGSRLCVPPPLGLVTLQHPDPEVPVSWGPPGQQLWLSKPHVPAQPPFHRFPEKPASWFACSLQVIS